MKGLKVAVLRGGPSAEYEVSLQTGSSVLITLEQSGFAVRDIVISRHGVWLVDGFPIQPHTALEGVDVAFLALHGEYGEDGGVQRMLERFCVPYTGSEPYPSAIAMNKVLTKDHIQPHGVRTAKHMLIRRSGRPDPVDTAYGINELFGPQFFVKPLRGGSSIDTQVALNVGQLAQVLTSLLQKYDDILVEERIIGREATVGILEDFRGERCYTMPVIEIRPPATNAFFDYTSKYNGSTEEICPGNFTASERKALQSAALTVHKTLGLRHYSRSDFIVTPDGPVFLEVNTLPGLTTESLFPKAVDAVGSSYQELIRHLLQLALRNI